MISTRSFKRFARARIKLAVIALTTTLMLVSAIAVSSAEESDHSKRPPDPAATRNDSEPSKRNREKAGAAEDARKDESVIAHWRFQNGLDGAAADGSRLIEDSSGNDRHGRAVGGPKFRAVNLPGSNLALKLDGHDDRVFVPDDESFHLTKSITIEAYIEIDLYPGSNAGFSHLVFRGDDRLGFDPWFLGIAESGQLHFLVADALSEASVVRSPEPIPTGQFVHVAAVLDDATGKQSLYINGKRVAATKTKIRAGGALGGANPGLGIGNRQCHSNQGFRGRIDEVRISSAALSPEEFLPPVEQ